MSVVRIAEVYRSIQGEGLYTGTPSVFVRTTGCNLRCWFCDTPYTSWRPEGRQLPWQEVLDAVRRFDCAHVVLTGGEPLLQPQLAPLADALRRLGHVVTVETAGTVYRAVAADLMSISPKLANSLPRAPGRWRDRHQRDQVRPDVVRRLIAESEYQLKFVVDAPADLEDITNWLARFPEAAAERVWLMPQGVAVEELAARAEWLAPAAARLGYRYCPRRHIELFGNVRGT